MRASTQRYGTCGGESGADEIAAGPAGELGSVSGHRLLLTHSYSNKDDRCLARLCKSTSCKVGALRG